MLRNAPERSLFQNAPSAEAPSFTPMSRFVPVCYPFKNAPNGTGVKMGNRRIIAHQNATLFQITWRQQKPPVLRTAANWVVPSPTIPAGEVGDVPVCHVFKSARGFMRPKACTPKGASLECPASLQKMERSS